MFRHTTFPSTTSFRHYRFLMRCSARHARNLFLVYATSLALGSGGGQAWAQTWDGQTNSNWNNPANWNPDGVPGVAATATIAGAGGTNQPIVNTNQTVALTNVTAGTLTVAATLTSNVNVSGTGTMTINAGNQVIGSVQVDPANGMVNNNGTVSGSLIVNGGTVNNAGAVTGSTSINSGTLNLNAGSNLADGQVLQVNGGTLSIQGVNDTVASVSLQSGSITGTGTLTSNSAFDLRSGSVSAVLGGAVGLNKTTAGTISLTGANTFTGATIINSGTLTAANATALGTTAAGTTVEAGATIEIAGGFAVAEAFSIAGNGVNGGGAIRIVSDAPSLNGAITLTADARINSDSPGNSSGFPAFITGAITGTNRNLTLGGSGNLVVTGAINLGTGTLTKDGNGQIALAGINTFGALTLSGGVLQMNGGAAIDDAAQVAITTGAVLLVSASETIGGLAGDATAEVFIDSGQTLTVGSNNTSSTFAGGISSSGTLTKIGTGTLTLTGANTYTGITTISGGTLQIGNGGTTGSLASQSIVNNAALVFNRSDAVTYGGAISGTGSLTKTGSGLLILTGTHSHTGGTTADNGTLVVNGTLSASSSTTTISGTATLGGNGTIVGPVNVTVTGQIYPATGSIGTLRTGPLTFASGTKLLVDLSSVGTHDQVIVTGNLDLGGATLDPRVVSTLPAGRSYPIIEFTGTRSGIFAGLPDGTVFTLGGTRLRITYGATSVTLTIVIDNLTRGQADAAFDLFAATGQAPGSGTFSGPGVNGGNYQPGTAVGVNEITFTPTEGIPVTFTITVTETPSLTVTTTSDAVDAFDGRTSLREALAHAATLTGAQTVAFSNSSAGGAVNFHDAAPDTITLGGTELEIVGNVTVDGPGADLLTVDANGNSRVFTLPGNDPAIDITLRGVRVANGSASRGGGLRVRNGILRVEECVFENNVAIDEGGALSSSAVTLTLTDSTFLNNEADEGGAIEVQGDGVCRRGHFEGNQSTEDGGAVSFGGGTFIISDTLFAGNDAIDEGGAIDNNGNDLLLLNCTLSGNTAGTTGGGINNQGGLTVVNSTLTGNRADADGAELNPGTPDEGFGGGGIRTDDSRGLLLLHNTLVAGNRRGAPGSDVAADLSTALPADIGVDAASSNNLIGDPGFVGELVHGVNGNIIGKEDSGGPRIEWPLAEILNPVLAANGGATLTHALAIGSPALDAGLNALALDETSAPLATDQRGAGFNRIVKGLGTSATAIVDIGAYELFAAPVFTSGDLRLSAAGSPVDLASATGVSPTGGVFSGAGVAGGLFIPRNLKPGTYPVTYTIEDAFGVRNVAVLLVNVEELPPALVVTKPRPFPDTVLNKRSREQRITIRNLGGTAVMGLRVVTSGSGRRDFRARQPVLKTLEGGRSTFFRVSFRPKKEGVRTARITVLNGRIPVTVMAVGRGLPKPVIRPPRSIKPLGVHADK